MYRKLIVLLMLSLFAMTASAQSSSHRLRPKWLQKQPTPTNSTFRYETVTASATSLDDARGKCLSELISSSGLSNGIVTVSDYQTKETISQVWNNGKLTERIEYEGNISTKAYGKEKKLYIQNIAEYWTKDKYGNFYLTKLYAKSALDTAPLFDNVEVTSRYGARGLWRSAIIPGWGQFYKGAYLKGGLILSGTAVLAAGIIFTENQRAGYQRRIRQTHDIRFIRSYQTKSEHFATARNICIGAAAALYLYNVIDAVAMAGAQRIVVKKRNNERQYTFLPSISNNGTPVIVASITF